MKLVATLLSFLIIALALSSMQGCSVNVIHADGATLAIRSDLSQNALQEVVPLCLGTDAGLIE